MSSTVSGEDYVRLIRSLSPTGGNSATAVRAANNAWDAWERAGVSRGADTSEIIANPDPVFLSYFDDIVLANALDKSNIHYCYAKTGDLNAFACTTRNGDYVIVFDSEFQQFIHSIVITSIVCVYSKPTDAQVEFYFRYLLNEIATFKRFKHANRVTPDDFTAIITRDYDLTMVGSYCGSAIYAFIICHELSHNTMGHTRKHRMQAIAGHNGTAASVSANDTSHIEEYEADSMGFQYYCEVVKQHSTLPNLRINTQFLSMPLVFFRLLEVVEQLFPVSRTTHPAPASRHAKIQTQKEIAGMHEDTEFHDALLELLEGFASWCSENSFFPLQNPIPATQTGAIHSIFGTDQNHPTQKS